MATYAGVYSEHLQDRYGNGYRNALVAVQTLAAAPVTLYADRTKTAYVPASGLAANEIKADTKGNLRFFADPGNYQIVVTPSGGTTLAAFPISVLPDPLEPDASEGALAAEEAARIAADDALSTSVAGKVSKAANLSDLVDVEEARGNLGAQLVDPNNLFLGPRFERVAGVQFDAAAGAFSTIYWPWVVRFGGVIDSPLADYGMYYSTDHSVGAGGIGLALGPTPEGPWTDHGQVFVDTSSGNQTETPSILWDEAVELFRMFYQQTSVSGAVGSQSTCLATSPDGVNWTRVGKVLDIAFATEQPADGHTGYFIPFRMGRLWAGYHLMGGTNDPRFGISYSDDGQNFITDQRLLGFGRDVGGSRYVSWNHSVPFVWRDRLWWIGLLADFSSGSSAKDARIGIAPLSSDLRRLLSPPEIIIDGTGPNESVNIRAISLYREGPDLFLHYQCDNNILLAKAVA